MPTSDLPIPRSHFLRTLSSGFGYLAFSALATRSAAKDASPLSPKKPHLTPRAKRVIFLCQRGGPSHVDTFDHKPALLKRTGESSPIGRGRSSAKLLGSKFEFSRHGESGLQISELFPEVARHADDLCILNGMHTDIPNHPQAFMQLHTGSFQFTRPSMGAWTLYGLGSENENLPGFVTINPPSAVGGARNYGSSFLPAVYQGTKLGGAQLPPIYRRFANNNDAPKEAMPNISNNELPRDLQRTQLDLIKSLNASKLARDTYHPEIEGAIESFELAFRMQDEIPNVLDFSGESQATLDLYGIDAQGQQGEYAKQLLMARRLSESGVRFVEVAAPVNWDQHFNLETALTNNCAATDGPIAALLEDLKGRGLLEDTLVIWGGEFGRTPYAQGSDGRDHNNKGFTMWMAGGGVKGGHIHGATDELGYEAVDGKTHIHDWHATVLHLLGLDHTKLTYRYAGRDFRLTDVYGDVQHGIIA